MAKAKTNTGGKGKEKHPGGRPRTKTPTTWTKAQLKQIDDMAEAQCKDTTIAERLEVDVKTFKAEFSQRTRQKRAEGKAKVMQAQYRGALSTRKGAATERIWWGKQHLEQRDKQDVDHGVTDPAAELMRELNGTRHYPGRAGDDGRSEES